MRNFFVSILFIFIFDISYAQKLYREGELLLKFRTNVTDKDKERKLRVGKANLLWKSRITRVNHIKLPEGLTVEKALEIYKNDPDVEYAEPNYIVRKAEIIPNDPYIIKQWFHKNTGQFIAGDYTNKAGTNDADIDTTDAWEITKGNSEIIIAVIDTGVDYNHPDLKDNIFKNDGEICDNGIDDDGNGFVDDCKGWNFTYTYPNRKTDNDPYDDDCDGHGTHIAGIIGALGNNSKGVVGINWNVKILPIKALTGPDPDCNNSGNTDIATLLSAMEYAIKMGARVVNASYTYPLSCSKVTPSFSEKEIITKMRDAGILFISAAGNYSCNNDVNPFYPASHKLENIISVSATNQDDNLANFSNYGKTSVHISAPGENIYSTVPERLGSYDFMTGTSMASPMVAGVAGLILSIHPEYTYKEVKNIILNSGDYISSLQDKTISGRRLNAFRALTSISLDSPPIRPIITSINLGSGKIYVYWNDNSSNESGFKIERQVNSNSFQQVGDLAPDTTYFLDDLLISEGTQCYRIRAYNNSGNSIYSNYKCIILPPTSPTEFYGYRVNKNEVQLYWKDNSYIEEGYEIERSVDGVIFQKIKSLSKNSYYFVDNVTDNVAYFYRVRAYANTGYSEYSYTIKVESYKDNESKNKSCFIATAVYGTPFHPHIDLLRDFRDRVLIRFDAGKAFVNIYYKYSPAIADIVGKSLILRFFCLLFILPLVYVIKFPLIAVLAFVFASGFYLKGFILKRF